MEIVDIEGFSVTGLVVRTTNAAEIKPETAKIGGLWESFYSTVAPTLAENAKVYGLYTNYASDAAGEFDVLACADTDSPNVLDNAVSLTIATGEYAKFSAQGAMPDVVITLWREVWAYFSANDCPYARAYTTDFEYYKNNETVEIFIAIK